MLPRQSRIFKNAQYEAYQLFGVLYRIVELCDLYKFAKNTKFVFLSFCAETAIIIFSGFCGCDKRYKLGVFLHNS